MSKEEKLLNYAAKAKVHAELVARSGRHLDKVSPTAAKRALASVESAIRLL